MRTTAWDTSCCYGKEVLDVINRNLSGAPPITNEITGTTYPPGRISHIFFGHDDTPVVGPWVHPNGNGVFPGQPSDATWNTLGQTVNGIFLRSQSTCAPDWAAEMHFDDGRQATVVRLDDLGDVFSKVNTHGFSLVTVHFPEDDEPPASDAAKTDGGQENIAMKAPRVDVRWIPIPR